MSGKYIVLFKDHATQAQIDKYMEEVASTGGQVEHKYDAAVKGFSATITDSYLQQLQSFQGDIIDCIEPDSIVKIQ